MSQRAGTERLDSGLAHAGVRSYVSGFAISILLTIAAYLMVTDRVLPTGPLIAVILVVALAQFGTQLYFFLHLGSEFAAALEAPHVHFHGDRRADPGSRIALDHAQPR